MMEYLGYIAIGAGATVGLTAAAFVIGIALAVPVEWVRRTAPPFVRGLVNAAIDVIRAVPNLVWLFLVFFGMPQFGIVLGPWPTAIIVLGMYSTACIAEILRGGIAAIGQGQWEAANALGLRQFDRARFVVAPQVLRVTIPVLATFAISLLKESALASTIGVLEITYRAGYATQRTGDGLTMFLVAGVIYLLLSLPLAFASRRVDGRLRARFSLG